ncbi:MAG: metallophosphoesterase, partial [Armatimonadota bacterium]
MRILFLGDIVGSVGRNAVAVALPTLREAHAPDLVIANGENAAAGFGITPGIADDLLSLGVDVITLGNHAFHRSEISTYLDSGKPIVRP